MGRERIVDYFRHILWALGLGQAGWERRVEIKETFPGKVNVSEIHKRLRHSRENREKKSKTILYVSFMCNLSSEYVMTFDIL